MLRKYARHLATPTCHNALNDSTRDFNDDPVSTALQKHTHKRLRVEVRGGSSGQMTTSLPIDADLDLSRFAIVFMTS